MALSLEIKCMQLLDNESLYVIMNMYATWMQPPCLLLHQNVSAPKPTSDSYKYSTIFNAVDVYFAKRTLLYTKRFKTPIDDVLDSVLLS